MTAACIERTPREYTVTTSCTHVLACTHTARPRLREHGAPGSRSSIVAGRHQWIGAGRGAGRILGRERAGVVAGPDFGSFDPAAWPADLLDARSRELLRLGLRQRHMIPGPALRPCPRDRRLLQPQRLRGDRRLVSLTMTAGSRSAALVGGCPTCAACSRACSIACVCTCMRRSRSRAPGGVPVTPPPPAAAAGQRNQGTGSRCAGPPRPRGRSSTACAWGRRRSSATARLSRWWATTPGPVVLRGDRAVGVELLHDPGRIGWGATGGGHRRCVRFAGILERSGIGDPDVLRRCPRGGSARASGRGCEPARPPRGEAWSTRVGRMRLPAMVRRGQLIRPRSRPSEGGVQPLSSRGLRPAPVSRCSSCWGRVGVGALVLRHSHEGHWHRDADAATVPAIDHRYCSDADGADMAVLSDGVRLGGVGRGEPAWAEADALPTAGTVRRPSGDHHHPARRMGEPPTIHSRSSTAILRVRGLEQLYVADCAVMAGFCATCRRLPSGRACCPVTAGQSREEF